jgi:hypothetical protein
MKLRSNFSGMLDLNFNLGLKGVALDADLKIKKALTQ